MRYLVGAILAVGVLAVACGGSGGSDKYLVLPGLAIKEKDYQSFLGSKALDWPQFCGSVFAGTQEPLRLFVDAVRQAALNRGVKLSDDAVAVTARKYAKGLSISSDYTGSQADVNTAISLTAHYCQSR